MQLFRDLPRRSSTPIALTVGNFDGVHVGHQAMIRATLEAARARSLTPAVMTFEPHPREFFSPDSAPARITTLADKLALLRSLGVAIVFAPRFNRAFASQTHEAFVALLVEQLGVRWLLTGADFRFGQRRLGGVDELARVANTFGFEFHTQADVKIGDERVSSTSVRDALAAGEFAHAQALLGRPFAMTGRVMHGEKLGRTLGFPTANIALKRRTAPVSGVFAVEWCTAEESGVAHAGVGAASLGSRPTVSDGLRALLEVYAFDFDGDLYGRRVRVTFRHKLRDQVRFDSLVAMREQMERDCEQARRLLDSTVSWK